MHQKYSPNQNLLTTLNLQVNNAQCQRSGEELFMPVSIQIKSGELAVIAGANGSGKTTLMEAMAGLSLFSNGSLILNESTDQASWLAQSHYLGHKLGNKGNLTCDENLRFSCHINQVKVTNIQIEQVLDQIGLAGYDFHFASDLSAGQKKRLALGRLLLLNKPIWLLDEPFVNLDHSGCEWLFTLIDSHINNNGIVILTAHDNNKIHQLADHHIDLAPYTEAMQ